ncbi:MAG: isochorismatase family cysteine hydrolase [archaeon]
MKEALLVIDILNKCSHPDFENKKWGITYRRIRRMIPKLEKFILDYKKVGGKVIYINCTQWDKKHLAKNIVNLYENNNQAEVYCKSALGKKFYKLNPEKDDLIITKNTYDAFTNPKLDKYLKKRKIKNLIITGIYGDGCVHATIQGGFSKGYNFTIIGDLIETTDVRWRQNTQKTFKNKIWPYMFGRVIKSSKFLNQR